LRIGEGEHPTWAAAIPRPSVTRVLATPDLNGDGRNDAVIAVRADCRPEGNAASWSLAVAWNRPTGWRVVSLGHVDDPVAQSAQGFEHAGARYLLHSHIQMANEGMAELGIYRVSGETLTPVQQGETPGCRGLIRVTPLPTGPLQTRCGRAPRRLVWTPSSNSFEFEEPAPARAR